MGDDQSMYAILFGQVTAVTEELHNVPSRGNVHILCAGRHMGHERKAGAKNG